MKLIYLIYIFNYNLKIFIDNEIFSNKISVRSLYSFQRGIF